MNISINQNNIFQPNFNALRVKVEGKYFDKYPSQKNAILNKIKNNEGLTEFFKDRNGEITIKACTVPARVYTGKCTYTYRESLPIRIFQRLRAAYKREPEYTYEAVPKMELNGTYDRPPASSIKRPVWFNGGIGGVDCDINEFNNAWDMCMQYMFKLIDTFGDKNEYRGLFNVEKRRQLHEYP